MLDSFLTDSNTLFNIKIILLLQSDAYFLTLFNPKMSLAVAVSVVSVYVRICKKMCDLPLGTGRQGPSGLLLDGRTFASNSQSSMAWSTHLFYFLSSVVSLQGSVHSYTFSVVDLHGASEQNALRLNGWCKLI